MEVFVLRVRKMTGEYDYSFGTNSFDFIDGIEAICQRIRTKVLLFYGEWWENLGDGIPMFQSIVGQMNPDSIKRSATVLLTQRILEVEEVRSVDNVEVDINDTRGISFIVSVTTDFGEASVEVIV